MDGTASPIPHKFIGVAVVWNEQRQILIDRRCPGGALGNLWEFPGGKVEPGETVEECIKREVWEEIGITIEVGGHLITIEHVYHHLRVTLTVHQCRYISGVPQPIECEEVQWVSLEEIDQFVFPKANEKIIEVLRSLSPHQFG